MKILTADQTRAADAHTIAHEGISSLDLMERASRAFVRWLCARYDNRRLLVFFCGKGNNGGDGLAVARLLSGKGYGVSVYVVEHTEGGSDDFRANLERLREGVRVQHLTEGSQLPPLTAEVLVVDALLGSGLTRPAEGLLAEVIGAINRSPAEVLSVDIASGLYMDKPNGANDVIVQPDYTVSFQLPKLAFLMPGNARFVGAWEVVDIGLSASFIADCDTPYRYTDAAAAEALIRPREKFAHKGTFGHALLLAGSFGKMGAAQLCGGACLRSGVGLLTLHVPRCGYQIVQLALPEAMASVDRHEEVLSALPDLSPYTAIGVGPGLGKQPLTLAVASDLLERAKVPMVWDADALNLAAENPGLLAKLPPRTVVTPHPKEFERLAGPTTDDYQRLERARAFAREHKLIVCLKGAHTAVVLSDGTVHFNSTGNNGMATGGSGDVLLGVITALLAQHYPPEDAARLGVYQHGLAGDRAARSRTRVSMLPSDLIEHLGW